MPIVTTLFFTPDHAEVALMKPPNAHTDSEAMWLAAVLLSLMGCCVRAYRAFGSFHLLAWEWFRSTGFVLLCTWLCISGCLGTMVKTQYHLLKCAAGGQVRKRKGQSC